MQKVTKVLGKCVDHRIGAAVGAACVLTVILFNGFNITDLRTIGVVLLIASLARWAILPALMPQLEGYKAGRESGYDEGYSDGRRVAKPTVVHIADVRASVN